MQVINKEIIKEEKYKQGGILICYIKDDYESIRENILDNLDNFGYIYYLLEMTPESCQELYFLYDAEEKIKKAECGIFVYSPIYQNKKYLTCLQMFYYVMGLIESKQKEVYPFLLKMESKKMKDSLRGKPKFVETQWTCNIQDIIHQIRKINVSKELYFTDDPTLNAQVLPRIKQVKITAIMHIYRDTLNFIWNEGWDDTQSEFNESSQKKMIDELYKGLKVGAIVVRFGKDETIKQPAFGPYLPESKIILFNSPAQYEKTIVPKPVENNMYMSDDYGNKRKTSSTIRLEFLIPVHDILGTSFKTYISINKESYWKKNHLLLLIKDTLVNECNIKLVNEQKESLLFFLLPTTVINPGEEINDMLGLNCNFIYPQ